MCYFNLVKKIFLMGIELQSIGKDSSETFDFNFFLYVFVYDKQSYNAYMHIYCIYKPMIINNFTNNVE